MKRTRLRSVSSKQRKKRKKFVDGRPLDGSTVCSDCGKKPATDMHHYQRRTRRPDLIDDPSNRVDLCRECHDKVEDGEGESYELARARNLHWHPSNKG